MFLFWSVFSAFMAILYLPLQVFPLPTAPEQRATQDSFAVDAMAQDRSEAGFVERNLTLYTLLEQLI